MSNEVYLSSLESKTFEPTRKCRFLKKLIFDTGKECMLVELDPPVNGQDFGISEDIKRVVLSSRHEGDSLFPVKEFPCFVFITTSLVEDITACERITNSDLQILAWGELYRTASDADAHIFD